MNKDELKLLTCHLELLEAKLDKINLIVEEILNNQSERLGQ